MKKDHCIHVAARFALLLSLAAAGAAHASTTQITTPGQWFEFGIDDTVSPTGGTEWIDSIDNSALSFSFTIAVPSVLRVVDAGFAGDSFRVSINGSALQTSAVPPVAYESNPASTIDFDAAWADANYSRGSFVLSAPGTYTVTGSLLQSVSLAGAPLNATLGAVMLAPVPEPSTWALLLAGLGVIGFAARRRA
jgi:hypothetical protein